MFFGSTPPGLLKRKGGGAPAAGSLEFAATAEQFDISKRLYISEGDQVGLGITDDLTIEFWMKTLQTYSGFQFIMRKEDPTQSSGFRANYRIDYTQNVLTFQSDGPTPGFGYNRGWTTGGSYPLNTWVHVAVTRERSTGFIKFYRDGVAWGGTDNGGTGAMPTGGASGFTTIGTADNGRFCCGARLAQMRVWSVARTPGEIAANYLSALNGSQPNLELCLPLVTDTNDLSPNGNDMPITAGNTPTIPDPVFVEDGPPLA
jgi:hypothetical protein